VARVIVNPEEFHLVSFDVGVIATTAEGVADAVGLPADLEVRVDVDETSPLGAGRLVALHPVTVSVQSGALEDAKRPRQLRVASVEDILGRLFFRARDRLDPAFGDPPEEKDLTLAQGVAWDAYSVGRCTRRGFGDSQARWRYHFRNRHGFTDVADATFDRLWSASGLTWLQLDAACGETEAARQSA
jgi:hypothetical protein